MNSVTKSRTTLPSLLSRSTTGNLSFTKPTVTVVRAAELVKVPSETTISTTLVSFDGSSSLLWNLSVCNTAVASASVRTPVTWSVRPSFSTTTVAAVLGGTVTESWSGSCDGVRLGKSMRTIRSARGRESLSLTLMSGVSKRDVCPSKNWTSLGASVITGALSFKSMTDTSIVIDADRGGVPLSVAMTTKLTDCIIS